MIFILSSNLFGGYTKHFNSNIESIEQVIVDIVNELRQELKRLNLNNLVDELNKLKFHYHDYTLIDVLSNNDANKVWYICECNK